MHGIRWRESSYRSTVNLLKSWRARTTDLLQEASRQVGMDLVPLSAPELFVKKIFRKKTPDYSGVDKIYQIKVLKYQGIQGGQEMFECQYMTREKEVGWSRSRRATFWDTFSRTARRGSLCSPPLWASSTPR
eukprot:5996610-Prymnesium_polylepis.1